MPCRSYCLRRTASRLPGAAQPSTIYSRRAQVALAAALLWTLSLAGATVHAHLASPEPLVCFLERPPAPHGVPDQIEVKFDIDANGVFSVTAAEKGLFFGCCGGEGPRKKQDIAITISRKRIEGERLMLRSKSTRIARKHYGLHSSLQSRARVLNLK
ncbi:hypothetical protein Scep_023414 [Stephania cephalantha]|uniref:Uncharacterized protein n=1 Tax=Stephania cephalantha TaxID=152367 RepID=A0AAP0F3M0_9MAGN